MQIIIGRVVGGKYLAGVSSKSGKAYEIINIYIAGAQNSVFESEPQKVSVPGDKKGAIERLRLMKPFEEICITVEQQPRSDGPDAVVFVDFFTMPGSVNVQPEKK